jgi:hypothetical protein
MNLAIFGLVLFGNIWIWRIFSFNIFLGLLVLATSVFLYLSKRIFLVLLILLLVFQWRTTSKTSLVDLSNDEIRIQHIRLKEYPGSLNFLGNWFEERKEFRALVRINRNFFETIDPNLYFFANHPRERVGITEFEKFPYIFLPFFIYGLFLSVKKHRELALILSFALPIFLISLIGHKNPLGPFAMFPFISFVCALGLGKVYQPSLKIGGLIIFVLVLLQTIAYAIY